MSIRIYIGNLPQGFNPKEFDKILKSVSDSIKFKAVLDKETKECRGFGFATTNNEENANLVCLLYTSPSPRDRSLSRMPSSA